MVNSDRAYSSLAQARCLYASGTRLEKALRGGLGHHSVDFERLPLLHGRAALKSTAALPHCSRIASVLKVLGLGVLLLTSQQIAPSAYSIWTFRAHHATVVLVLHGCRSINALVHSLGGVQGRSTFCDISYLFLQAQLAVQIFSELFCNCNFTSHLLPFECSRARLGSSIRLFHRCSHNWSSVRHCLHVDALAQVDILLLELLKFFLLLVRSLLLLVEDVL